MASPVCNGDGSVQLFTTQNAFTGYDSLYFTAVVRGNVVGHRKMGILYPSDGRRRVLSLAI